MQWKKSNRPKKSNSYYRVIWLGCLSASIPILLGGIVFYYSTISRLIDQLETESKTTLHMIMTQTEKEMLQIENEAIRISLDPSMNRAFLNPEFNFDYLDQLNLISTLTSVKTSHSEIDDIFFYKRSPKLLLSNSRGYVYANDIKELIDEKYILAMDWDDTWLPKPNHSPLNDTITYLRKLPTMHYSPSGALIMRMNLQDVFPNRPAHQRLIVFDKRQSLLYDSGFNRLSFNENIHQELLNNKSAPQLTFTSFKAKENDDKTYNYTIASSVAGRQYVLGIPQSDITKQLSGMKWWFTLTIMTFLLVGIVLSYFSSRRAYNPILELRNRVAQLSESYESIEEVEDEVDYIDSCIGYLNQKNEKLDAYIQVKKPSLRERLLLQLLERKVTDTENIRAELEDYQIPYNKKFVAIVISVEKLYKEKRFPAGEEHVIDFSVRNVIEEIQQQQVLSGFTLTISPGQTVALLYFDEKASVDEAVLTAKRYIKECIAALQKYLKFTASGGIGGISSCIMNISFSYAEAVRALQHRVHSQEENIFYFEEFMLAKKNAVFMYPLELEHEIIRSLIIDDSEEAQTQLKLFSETVSMLDSYQAVSQCYTLLLSSIIQSLERHRTGTGAMYELNLFDQLKQRQTSEEIREWFVEQPFKLFHKKVHSDSHNPAGYEAVQYICRYIKMNIGEGLSLVQCAELVNMSTAHLSRLFKKEVNMSFIDYLTASKLDEAKRLLVESDLSIAEIAKRVGYADRNLNRVFRSKLNISPMQYRKRFR